MIKSILKFKLFACFTFALTLILVNETQAQWMETGNNLFTTGTFGSLNNFDVLFRTDDVNRMRLMETSTYTVDGYNIDNSGFLYLGLTPAAIINTEPQSILHIDGTGNLFNNPQEQGYRDWMPAGF